MLKTFKFFFHAVRTLFKNNSLKNTLNNYFDDNIFTEEYSTIVRKWIYQSVKWIHDMSNTEYFEKDA
jgi:hypothetical protein